MSRLVLRQLPIPRIDVKPDQVLTPVRQRPAPRCDWRHTLDDQLTPRREGFAPQVHEDVLVVAERGKSLDQFTLCH
jgi:hypothetical protein